MPRQKKEVIAQQEAQPEIKKRTRKTTKKEQDGIKEILETTSELSIKRKRVSKSNGIKEDKQLVESVTISEPLEDAPKKSTKQKYIRAEFLEGDIVQSKYNNERHFTVISQNENIVSLIDYSDKKDTKMFVGAVSDFEFVRHRLDVPKITKKERD